MTKPTGNPRGRPKNTANEVGRPKGEAVAMAEFRKSIIRSPKSKKVLERIFDAALDDQHKLQGVAWKLLVDRIAPLSGFEKEAGGQQRSVIKVEIASVVIDQDQHEKHEAIQAEYSVVTPETPETPEKEST